MTARPGIDVGGFRTQLRRGAEVFRVFVWMGYKETMSYPLAFAVTLVSALASPVIYYFVGELVTSGPSVGDDYFTFAMIGLVTSFTIQGALSSFSTQLDFLVRQGTFETLLVEPVSWRFLPFAIVGWPIIQALFNAAIMICIGAALGVTINAAGIPLALLVLVLGIASGHAVGVLAASVKVLSKRSDPILSLYLLVGSVLSGVVFPITVLPAALRVLSYLIPLTYVLTGMRQALMVDTSGLSGPSATEAVLLLVGFLIVVYPLGLWLYGRALEYGRKLGVLAGY